MIELKDVSFHQKTNLVLNNVNLKINDHKFYIIYGKNGSGKSTTIKLMLKIFKLKKNDKGSIFCDFNKINYFPEKFILPSLMNSHKFLYTYFDSIIGQEIINSYTKKYNVENKLICKLSKGMGQKLILIKTILEDAECYLFDEPLNGLDDESRGIFLNDLKKLKEKGKTIVVITHEKDFFHSLVDEEIKIGE